ncbi:MAG: hypothetical protein AAF851_07345 [Myxococcota bacterium]
MIFRGGSRISTATAGSPKTLMLEARRRARPDRSGFRVGAVALDAQGDAHLGFNLEFGSLGSTVHAEQCALVSAYESGPTQIESLWVDAAPCGHCRQFILEFGDPWLHFEGRRTRASALLPQAFSPKALTGSPSPLAKARSEAPPPSLELEALAQWAAQTSHHPYTRVPSGLAAVLNDGTLMTARVLESVAFNPSVTPLASLLIQLAQLQVDLQTLRIVLLHEGPSPVHDPDLARWMLRRLAPGCAWRHDW